MTLEDRAKLAGQLTGQASMWLLSATHNRALRYMVKRMLRDLWAADRKARG